MSDLVSVDSVHEAAARIAEAAVRTPLVPCALPGHTDPVLIKPESLQPTGSFKLRGATSVIGGLHEEERQRGVVAHSSGNHARAVAYVGRAVGAPVVLVMPRTAPTVKVDACQALGAEIVFVEPTMAARVETVQRLAAAHGYTPVPPFDDRTVIAGQGTIGLEIADDMGDRAYTVLVPVGGGGLISGVAAAIKADAPRARVVGVEPELASDARDSLRAGERIGWPGEDTARTVADALRVDRVGELPFAHIQAHVDDILTVTDEEIRAAMACLARDARMVAEPAGAVACAAYLYHRAELPAVDPCVCVLSGGNVEPHLLGEALGLTDRGSDPDGVGACSGA